MDPDGAVRRPRTAAFAVALLALLCAGRAATGRPDAPETPAVPAPSPEAVDLGETYVSDAGRRFRAFRDAATGAKWLEGEDGRRWDSVGAIALDERARLSATERVVAPDLLARCRAAAASDEAVHVVFLMARQPAAEVSEEVFARDGAAIEERMTRRREFLARVAAAAEDEGDVSDADRADAQAAGDEARALLVAARREIVDRARPAAFADQEALVADVERVGGARVLARTFSLSTVAARLPLSAVLPLVAAHPEVARAELELTCAPDLNTATSVTGASTWWTAGYDGSTSTRVAILDTGVDTGHAALSGIVAASAVHLSSGSAAANFNDNASSTDDLYFHGTHVAGCSASNDSTYKGVAPGARLLNAKCGYLNTSGTGSFQSADCMSAGDWACDNAADVLNCSFGGSTTTNGNSTLSLFFDAVAYDLAVSCAMAAGNSGSSSGTIVAPADGFNVVAVGNFNDNGTTSTSDDSIYSGSSRGPCSDGRRKPDLAAPGTSITSAYAKWESSSDYVGATGTSAAAPLVAGGLAILYDAAVATYPEGLKALLLTNCTNSSPAPSTPDNDWGCGAFNLSAAYTNRAALRETSMSSSGDRYVFLKPGALAANKRVTLCWGRRVVSNGSSTPSSYSSLLDLDLYVYDESDGSSDGSSASTVNSVEQVKLATAPTTPVVKVYRASSSWPSGLSTQRFAVAAENTSAISVVTKPTLSCSLSGVTTPIAASTQFTVTATVSNTGGLAAQAPSVTLTLPSGYALVSGSNPQTLANVAASGSRTATWTVRSGTTSGTQSLSVSASSSSYGETFTSATASASQVVDATAPTGTVSVASYTGSTSVTATFSASDAHSSVSKVRYRDSAGTWSSWVNYATSATVTLTSGDGTHTVQAEFQDAVGNTSSTVSDTIGLDTTAPTGTVSVANGADWVTSTTVTLYLTSSDAVSGVAEIRSSNNGSTWNAWSTYQATAGHTLTATDGQRTVYVQLRDNAGNVSASFTDTVGLDRSAPTGTVTVAGGAAWVASTAVTLTLSASDATSGPSSMRFSNDGSTWGSWTSYATSASWTLASGDGSKTVHAQFRDAAGNVSSSANDPVGLDTTAPSGTVTVAGGADWTTAAAVTLTCSASDATAGVADMRFSDDGTTWGAWQTSASSAAWTLPGADGTKTVHAQFRDAAGNVSPAATDSIGLDRAGPAGSVTIDGGADWTGSLSVTLTLAASDGTAGVADMRLSADGSAWTAWATFASSSAWTLSGSDGTKSVHAQFRDAAGNVSLTSSDTIGLDRVAPTGTVTVAGGADWTTSRDVTLTLSAADTLAGVTQMRLADDGGAWGSWQTYATSAAWTLRAGDGTKTVNAQFRDAAGNVSSTASDTVGLDTTAPAAAITVAGGADWTAASAVTLDLAPTDATSGVSAMRFSDDGTTWSAWETCAATWPWTLPGADGAKTVHAQFRDVAGNVSASASDGVGLDRAAPSGTIVVAGGAAWTTTAGVSLTLAGGDATSGVASMRFSDDGTTWSAWTAYATSASRTLPGADGTKTVHVQYRDAAGNDSVTSSDSVGLDRDAPSASVVVDGDAAWTADAEVDLALSSSDALSGVAEMRFSEDGATWSAWAPYAGAGTFALTGGDGTKAVHAQFRDTAGNVSPSSVDTVGLDRAAPTGSLAVAAGAEWVVAESVALDVSGTDATSGVAAMRFSDDGVAWSSWTSYAAAASWTLPGADGAKTVYAQLRDAAGNVSLSIADTVGLDRVAPTATLSVNGGAEWTNTADVTLGVSGADATSGVASMRFSDDGSNWSAWTAHAATASRTLPGADGTKTVHVQVRDAAGNVSLPAADGIGLDRAAPEGSLVVDGGAAWTADVDVALAPSATDALSGVAHMRFSNDGTTWSDWAAHADAAAWTLAGPDGACTVRVQFRDVAGNVSAAAEDSVGLDRVAPEASLAIDGGAAWASGTAVTLGVGGTDATSGVAHVRFSDDGATWSGWAAFAAAVPWTLPGADGAKSVHVQVRDAAGNVSLSSADAIGLDRAAPSGSVTLAGGAPWTAAAAVAVGVDATDATSGVTHVRFSDDGAAWSAWEPYAGEHSWTLPGADGTKTVHAQYRDAAGNVSLASADDVGLDRVAPSGGLVVADGAAWTTTRDVTLAPSASDATSGVASMRFSSDGATWTPWAPFAASAAFTLTADEGAQTVHVQYRDVAGNVAAAVTDDLGLDTVAPQGTVTILGGAPATSAVEVALDVTSSDATSGVAAMRFSTDGAAWSEWQTAAATATFALADGEGVRAVHVQIRDLAGNVSAAASDDVVADRTAPAGTVVLADGAEYLPPGAPLVAALASGDGATGSGVTEFRWSHDGGAAWSAWTPGGDAPAEIGLPDAGDLRHAVLVEFRDAAGNVSAPASDDVHLLSRAPQDLSAVRSFTGALDTGGDVDDLRLELQQGDRLDVRVTAKGAFRGADAALALDLFDPDGGRLATGRYPEASAAPGVKGFVAARTGTYRLVLRGTGADAAAGLRWKLTSAIRAARVPAVAGAADAAPVEIALDACAGRALTGTFRGPVAPAAELEGPEGDVVPLTLRAGRGGTFSVPRTLLARGSGTYVLRVAASDAPPAAVSWTLRLAPPRRAARAAETN